MSAAPSCCRAPAPSRIPASGTESYVSDEAYIERAIALAERGSGLVSPNPMVGAVVVADGTGRRRGLARGPGPAARRGRRARRGGRPRPRRDPLHVARALQSPRTHAALHGRRSSRAGVARVVSATSRPEPGRRRPRASRRCERARGRGSRGGPWPRRPQRLNEAFVKHVRTGTAVRRLEDGRVARRQGRGARRLVAVDHRRGRAGRRPPAAGVVRRDRGRGRHRARRRPRRSRFALPGYRGRAAAPGPGGRARTGAGDRGPVRRRRRPRSSRRPSSRPRERRETSGAAAGAEVVVLEHRGRRRVRSASSLRDLGKRDVQGVLLEGGPTLAWSAVEERHRRRGRRVPRAEADRRREAPGVLGGPRVRADRAARSPLRIRSFERIGEDLRVEADVHRDR